MKKILLGVIALVALVAAPAFAAVQNVKVSGDIDSTYINRNQFNLGSKKDAASIETGGLINQSAFITQTRLRVDADLSDNVSTTVGLINERAWDAEMNAGTTAGTTVDQKTNVQLYLAYVTLREMLYSPLTVTVGKQIFHYGNGLILGDGGANNAATGNLATVAADLTKRTSYDGVKAILDYKPLTLDLLYFKNSSSNTSTGGLVGGTRAVSDDSDVYGINANYQLGDAMNTVGEGYFFSRTNGKNNGAAALASNQSDTLYVPGLRVSTNPIAGLNVQGEVAWQLGTKAVTSAAAGTGGDNIRREAMAYQLMTSYTVPVYEKYKPMVNASYTHVSGDSRATEPRSTAANYTGSGSSSTYSAWDPLNEAQGSGTIYNTLFNLTNLNILSAGATVTPLEDVSVGAQWHGLYADKRFKAGENTLTLIQPDGTTIAPATSNTGRRDLGSEYDLNVNYAYTEDVTFGVSLGWFVPGRTFDGVNNDVASQALAHVLVNF